MQGLDVTIPSQTPYQGTGAIHFEGAFTSNFGVGEKYLTVDLGAPAGGPLHVGVYADAIDRSSSREEDMLPTLRVFRSDVGVGEVSARGQFEVLKVTYDIGGYVTAFHATFSLKVDGASGGLSGEIQYNIDSTASSVNQPPGVFAGGTLAVLPGTPVVLPAIVSDDNLPLSSPLTYTWSVPGNVTLDNANTLRPTATFPGVGRYDLTLFVSDGDRSAANLLYVDVLPPGIESVIRVSSVPGEQCFRGRDYRASRFDGSIWFYTSFGTILSVNASTRAGIATFDFSGLHLTPGNLTPPGIYPIANGNGTVGLSVSGPKGNSYGNTGTLDLRRLTMNASGEITELWMFVSVVETLFRDNLPSGRPLLFEVRYGLPEGTIPDQPTLVTAGSDQTVMQRQRATLTGNVLSDDAIPLTLAWSVVSGPGDVQFVDPSAQSTEAIFSEPGTYVLRLTADDGVHAVSDEVTIEKVSRETSLIFQILPIATGASSIAKVYTADECRIVPTLSQDHSGLDIDITTDGYPFLKLNLRSGDAAQVLQTGYYHSPVNLGPYEGSHAWLTCYNPVESVEAHNFVIRELTIDDDGNVLALHVEIESDRLNRANQLRAEIRFNASSHSVTGENHAPRVAVADPHTVPSVEFNLEGIVADDGLPEDRPLQISWEKIEGPGDAAIDGANTLRPFVYVSKQGVYRFRLTVSDGDLTSSADSLVVVKPGSRQYHGVINLAGAAVGQFTVTRRGNDSFTARFKLPGTSFPLKGKLVDGLWETSYLNADGKEVSYKLRISPDGTGVAGIITLNGRVWELLADQTQAPALAAAGRKADRIGNYNLLLNATDSGTPTGFGFTRVIVGGSGSARGVARLPDGTPVLFSSMFTIADELPFFAPLYGGKGSLAGSFAFEGASCNATLSWLHPERPKHPPFAAGFFSRVNGFGDRYQPPARGLNILSQEPGDRDSVLKAVFDNGTEVFQIPLRFTGNGPVTPLEPSPGFSFTAQPRTGLFRGTFRDARDGKLRSFTGILNPAHAAAAGFFITSEGSGRVMLSGAN